MDRPADQGRRTLGDRQPEAKPLAPIALGIAELDELLENPLPVGLANPGPGVPDLQP